MKRHGRLVAAVAVAVALMSAAAGVIAYVLTAGSQGEEDHRAQVLGTIIATAVIVPAGVRWAWQLIVEHERSVEHEAVASTATGPRTVDLTGDWFSAWQTFKDGAELVAVQAVTFKQQGELIQVETIARGRPVEDGGYHWAGELRLWDNEILMGWYASTDSSVRSKGTMYFALHPQGREMAGRWVGLSYDGKIVTGWGSMARTDDEAQRLAARLGNRSSNGPEN